MRSNRNRQKKKRRMKTTAQILLVLAGFGIVGAKRSYSTRFDNMDIEAVIKNERLLKNYIGCLLDRNPCTADASEMKKNLPDALATNCADCTDSQRRMSDRLSHHLIDHKPEDWRQLEDKYDPTGDYRRRYQKQQQQQQQNQESTTISE